MPPPTPVPTVTISMSSTSSAAPNANSPHAAAFASFSTTTGRSTRRWISLRRSSSRHAMLGANMTTERFASTYPAAPMPTAVSS